MYCVHTTFRFIVESSQDRRVHSVGSLSSSAADMIDAHTYTDAPRFVSVCAWRVKVFG